jgi:galactokinase
VIRASAPGRVNLIGEHTDYNDGFVLPIATPQGTVVELRRRDDRVVSASSANMPEASRTIAFTLGEETRTGGWSDYVAGVTSSLRERGVDIGGFDAAIASTLPLGAGLSSSASLEVALLRAIDAAFALRLDPVAIASIAHRAETGLVGAPVGIMDQMAASLADARAALFLDTRTRAFERLPLPEGTALIVIHSGVAHRHAAGDYRVRRRECEEAAHLLGVAALRDASDASLADMALPEPIDRRARHVVTENARVMQAVAALRAADARAFGALMNASHVSMRDDFEVSTPEVDALVDLAQREATVFGARLTGGGFGGSIVALAEAGGAPAAAIRIAGAYRQRTNIEPTILVPLL